MACCTRVSSGSSPRARNEFFDARSDVTSCRPASLAVSSTLRPPPETTCGHHRAGLHRELATVEYANLPGAGAGQLGRHRGPDLDPGRVHLRPGYTADADYSPRAWLIHKVR